jgi:hypothetical protein
MVMRMGRKDTITTIKSTKFLKKAVGLFSYIDAVAMVGEVDTERF